MSTFNCSDIVIFTGDPVKSQRFLVRRALGQPYRITRIRHTDNQISFDGGHDFYSANIEINHSLMAIFRDRIYRDLIVSTYLWEVIVLLKKKI